MKIQENMSTYWTSAKDTIKMAAEWMGKKVEMLYGVIADYAAKAAEFAKPHFDKAKNFVSEYKGYIALAVVTAAALYAVKKVFEKLCCAAKPATT